MHLFGFPNLFCVNRSHPTKTRLKVTLFFYISLKLIAKFYLNLVAIDTNEKTLAFMKLCSLANRACPRHKTPEFSNDVLFTPISKSENAFIEVPYRISEDRVHHCRIDPTGQSYQRSFLSSPLVLPDTGLR